MTDQLNEPFRYTSNGQAYVDVSFKIYTLASVFRTCYTFTDRCYLYLTPCTDGVRIYLKTKEGGPEVGQLAGELCNELINQQVREDVNNETRRVRELLIAHALAEGNLLDATITEGDVDTDPLGVTDHQ